MACSYSIAAACSSLLVLLTGCGTSSPLPNLGVVQDFTLTGQDGREFHSAATLRGKVWIADFIFTHCPGPCPRMSSRMHKLQGELGGSGSFRFVSFTVDPARDTPAVLAEYGKQFGARDGVWYFLTSSQAALQQLARYTFKLADVDGELEHSTRLVLIDKFGRIRGYYPSESAEQLPQLIADAKGLVHETL
jgi:protein SCO1